MKPRRTADRADRLVDQVHEAVDHGQVRRAQRLLARLDRRPLSPEVAFARWRLTLLDEDRGRALAAATAGVEAFPDVAGLQHALGSTQLEIGALDEAVVALEEACTLDPELEDAWYELAVARERSGDPAGMRAAFARVWELDSTNAPAPRFSERVVTKMADAALAALPQPIREATRDLPIILQPYPDRWILDDPPWDPRLLGLFDGPTWAELRGGMEGGVRGSPRVTLYTDNLERICGDRGELAEQVRITLHHEVGHFLGLDERQLHERGLG